MYLLISWRKTLRYALWLSLAWTAILGGIAEASSAARHPRSIWPFISEPLTAESLMSKDNALALKKAGLEKSLDLSSHPLWKIHRYEGIDLKPVRIDAGLIKADEPKAIEPSSTETDVGSTAAPARSFLDNFVNFLPNIRSEDDATEAIAKAIKKEESSHPGFLKKLWGKILGVASKKIELVTKKKNKLKEPGFFSSLFNFGQQEEEEEDDGTVTIFLPETQGSYATVILPSPEDGNNNNETDVTHQDPLFSGQVGAQQVPQQSVHLEYGPPPNHANHLSEAAQKNPVNTEFNRSEAWVQSWTPHAAYTLHVRGPASTAVVPETTSPEPQQSPADVYQRKSSEAVVNGAEIEQRREEKEEGQVQESPKQREVEEKSIVSLPEALLKKFQVNPKDVEAILNNEESAARAKERLRALQREFEVRKDQLSYVFPSVKKNNPQ